MREDGILGRRGGGGYLPCTVNSVAIEAGLLSARAATLFYKCDRESINASL